MKAVVLETQGSEAALLVNDGTVRIAHGKFDVGDVIDYKSVTHPVLYQWIAAAAAMVVLLAGSVGMWIDRNYVTYAEVSLDVNPSIVYALNSRDRVLEVRAANEDAEPIVAELDIARFSPLSDAIEKTMSVLEDEGYLSDETDDYVLVNVSADDDARQTRLTGAIEIAMTAATEQDPTMEYQIDHSDRETAREAQNHGMSVGRYSAWQKADDTAEADDRPEAEEFARKPVRELLGHEPKSDESDVQESDGEAVQPPDKAPGGDRQESASPADGEGLNTKGLAGANTSPDPQQPMGQDPESQIPENEPVHAAPQPETGLDSDAQPARERQVEQQKDSEQADQPVGQGEYNSMEQPVDNQVSGQTSQPAQPKGSRQQEEALEERSEQPAANEHRKEKTVSSGENSAETAQPREPSSDKYQDMPDRENLNHGHR